MDLAKILLLLVSVIVAIFMISAFAQMFHWLSVFKGGLETEEDLRHLNHHALYMTLCFGVLLLLGGLGRFLVRAFDFETNTPTKIVICLSRMVVFGLFIVGIFETTHISNSSSKNDYLFLHKFLGILAMISFVVYLTAPMDIYCFLVEKSGLSSRFYLPSNLGKRLIEEMAWKIIALLALMALDSGFFAYFKTAYTYFDLVDSEPLPIEETPENTEGMDMSLKKTVGEDSSEITSILWLLTLAFSFYLITRIIWRRYAYANGHYISYHEFRNNFQNVCKTFKK